MKHTDANRNSPNDSLWGTLGQTPYANFCNTSDSCSVMDTCLLCMHIDARVYLCRTCMHKLVKLNERVCGVHRISSGYIIIR